MTSGLGIWGRLAVLGLTLFTLAWTIKLAPLSPFGLVLDEAGNPAIQDFASHRQFAGAYWRQGAGYDVASHLRMMEEWAGRPLKVALPFGYSPIMLVVLGPFCVPSALLGYALWVCVGIACLAAELRRPSPGRTALALLVFSPLSLVCIELGQTAFLSVAGLLFLVHREVGRADGVGRRGWAIVAPAVVLSLLAAKPPLAVLAGAALFVRRQYLTIVIALGLTTLATVLLTPGLGGWKWVGEYRHLLATYNRTDADPAFAWSLVPSIMSNLRGVLFTDLGWDDAVASRVSLTIWLASMTLLAGVGLWRPLSARVAWSSATLLTLMFCPHLTLTEDLALAVPLALAWSTSADGFSRWAPTALVWLTLAFSPTGDLAPIFRKPPVIFLGKAILLVVLWAKAWPQRTTEPTKSDEPGA